MRSWPILPGYRCRLVPAGNHDNGGLGPYVIRYNDDQTRFGDRLGSLERLASAFDVRISALEGSLRSHLDRASSDAERAAVSATATLSEISKMREDISVMKARHGTVPVETIQRLVAIIGGGFTIFGMIVAGIIWLAEIGGA